MDIWLGGNFYALKLQADWNDGSLRVSLKGGLNRSFTNQPQPLDGIYTEEEVRDAAIIHSKNSKRLIVARNNDGVALEHMRGPGSSLRILKTTFCIVHIS